MLYRNMAEKDYEKRESKNYSNDLDARLLLRKAGRREFLKTGMNIALAGGAVFGAVYGASQLTKEWMIGVISSVEGEVREVALNVEALSGELERRLRAEMKKFEQNYTGNRMKLLEDIGVATPADLSELEQIIKNYDEFEDHYNIVERLKIFKDRIDNKLLNFDAKYEPGVLRKINDGIRGLFGKKTGEEGVKAREAIRSRLANLCKIYDINEDNRRAQPEVLKRINFYLENVDALSPEERSLYEFLKEQFEKGTQDTTLKDFIMNYGDFDERNLHLLTLRASLTEAVEVYDKIRENKDYMLKLQDLLKQGIALKEEVREKAPEELRKDRERIEEMIGGMRTSFYGLIDQMKNEGYGIETREDYKSRRTFTEKAGKIVTGVVDSIAPYISAGLAGLAAIYAYRFSRRGSEVRAGKTALTEAVRDRNAIAADYRNLKIRVDREAKEQRRGIENYINDKGEGI